MYVQYVPTYSKLLQCHTTYILDYVQCAYAKSLCCKFMTKIIYVKIIIWNLSLKTTWNQISVGRLMPICNNLHFRFKTIRDDGKLLLFLLNFSEDAAKAVIAKMISLLKLHKFCYLCPGFTLNPTHQFWWNFACGLGMHRGRFLESFRNFHPQTNIFTNKHFSPLSS